MPVSGNTTIAQCTLRHNGDHQSVLFQGWAGNSHRIRVVPLRPVKVFATVRESLVGIYIAIAGVAFLAYTNRDQLKKFIPKKRAAVLTSVVSSTSPDIHEAVDAVRVLQSFFDPETAARISEAAGARLFNVGGSNDVPSQK